MTVPSASSLPSLDNLQASKLAALALTGITREYPNAPEVVLNSDRDVLTPRALHPAFYGCFDWHSAVHGHWMLARLLRLFPGLPQAGEIRRALDANLTPANLKVEADYFRAPNHNSFERTYGWAWLLKLARELSTWQDPSAAGWSDALQPLVEVIVQGYLEFLPRQAFPIRVGTHANTAFGLAFAYEYAQSCQNSALEELIKQRSLTYYLSDRDYPASWEPGGNDFLSPALVEADLMSRLLPRDEYCHWFHEFLPDLPGNLLSPIMDTDRADLQLVHLDGLNLSRAWCLGKIAAALPEADPFHSNLLTSATSHARAGLEHVFSGNYRGEHWLASFAVYLLNPKLLV